MDIYGNSDCKIEPGEPEEAFDAEAFVRTFYPGIRGPDADFERSEFAKVAQAVHDQDCADKAETLEVLEHLIDIPQGCMCPNNGGGDCDWCQEVDHARLLLEDKGADRARQVVHIVFDGPPGHESGRFIETETPDGKGIRIGRWEQKGDYWHLIIQLGRKP